MALLSGGYQDKVGTLLLDHLLADVTGFSMQQGDSSTEQTPDQTVDLLGIYPRAGGRI